MPNIKVHKFWNRHTLHGVTRYIWYQVKFSSRHEDTIGDFGFLYGGKSYVFEADTRATPRTRSPSRKTCDWLKCPTLEELEEKWDFLEENQQYLANFLSSSWGEFSSEMQKNFFAHDRSAQPQRKRRRKASEAASGTSAINPAQD